MSDGPASGGFQATRWTLVRRAQGESSEARAALSELCAVYYQPVFAFLRGTRRTEDEARELTQEFFARLLGSANVGGAEPDRGKFRSFLLGAVKHFLSDRWDHGNAAKRGGGMDHVPIDTGTDSSLGMATPKAIHIPDDAQFDREWALALLARGIGLVEGELRDAGKVEQFTVLKPWLTGESTELSVPIAARELGMSEGAVKVAIHRLRQRFRAAVRSEIAQTVESEGEVAAEMSYMVQVLAR